MASVLLSIFFCAVPALAQTEPLNAQKSDVWELHYWVAVKGDFKKEPELGSGDPTIFYHIKRNYEGASKLVFAARPSDNPKATLPHPMFKDPAAAVHLTINDARTTVYDPICDEVLRVEDTWKAEVYSWMGNKTLPAPALLLINNETHIYKTSFPILYSPAPNSYDIEHTRKEITNLMSGVDKVDKVYDVERQSLVTHNYPNVTGFIEHYSIIRAPDWSELKWEESFKGYSWTSEVLHPDAPLIDGVPDSKDKVDILIRYNFIRVKG